MAPRKPTTATQVKDLLRQLSERDLLRVIAAHMRQLENNDAIAVLETVGDDIIRRSKNYIDLATEPNEILDGYRLVSQAGEAVDYLWNGCYPYSVGCGLHAERVLLEKLGGREFEPEFALIIDTDDEEDDKDGDKDSRQRDQKGIVHGQHVGLQL